MGVSKAATAKSYSYSELGQGVQYPRGEEAVMAISDSSEGATGKTLRTLNVIPKLNRKRRI